MDNSELQGYFILAGAVIYCICLCIKYSDGGKL